MIILKIANMKIFQYCTNKPFFYRFTSTSNLTMLKEVRYIQMNMIQKIVTLAIVYMCILK